MIISVIGSGGKTTKIKQLKDKNRVLILIIVIIL